MENILNLEIINISSCRWNTFKKYIINRFGNDDKKKQSG